MWLVYVNFLCQENISGTLSVPLGNKYCTKSIDKISLWFDRFSQMVAILTSIFLFIFKLDAIPYHWTIDSFLQRVSLNISEILYARVITII